MLCKIKNLSLSFKNNSILNNINLEINPGEIIGIIGENGCGKSMLLRTICGLVVPTRGIVKSSEDIDFGVIIEDPGFMNELSGYENLLYLASIKNKISKEQILDAIEKVGLLGFENKKVRTYSLGMKKKLGIAQAIMENQSILLLDEPFNALDDTSCENIENLLSNYIDDTHSIVLVSHRKQDIENLCTRVLKFKDGSLIQVK